MEEINENKINMKENHCLYYVAYENKINMKENHYLYYVAYLKW